MKKFKQYVVEDSVDRIGEIKIDSIMEELMDPDFIEPETDLADFESGVKKILHDEFEEHADPAHIIAGYATRKITKKDLELLMVKLLEVLADKSVDVKAYYGVNLGRLEVIIDRMIKQL
jgi:hypothetical protein